VIARRAAIAALLTALVLSACGGKSKQQQAMSDVCSARADIQTQVTKLRGLTLSLSSLSTAQSSLKAIGDDVTKMRDAQKNLSSQSKAQVQQANQAFETQVKQIASNLTSTRSLTDAPAQLTAAGKQLVAAYKQTLAQLTCN
jgi:valyl-tRNA synthetase